MISVILIKKVIRNLNKIDTTIYSTAVYGNIILYTEGSEYMIDIEKKSSRSITRKDKLMFKTGLWEK